MLELNCSVSFANFNLHVEAKIATQGVTALYGPSGSGKTMLLRTIAGFENPTGYVKLDGETWFDSRKNINVAPHRRRVGYLFQDSRLFSHFRVMENLRYPIRCFGLSEGPCELNEVIEKFDLSTLVDRYPDELSGGETQRVALARTFLMNPQLLLLDEPLSAVDIERKAEIIPYIDTLAKSFAIPTLLVTHSVDEVATLSDAMIVLNEGKVVTTGSTSEILEGLDLQSLTGRYEAGSVVNATISAHDYEYRLSTLQLNGASLLVPLANQYKVGHKLRIRVRARDVSIALQQPIGISIQNVLRSTIISLDISPNESSAELLLRVGEERIRSRVTRKAVTDLQLTVGDEVYALIKSVTLEAGQ